MAANLEEWQCFKCTTEAGDLVLLFWESLLTGGMFSHYSCFFLAWKGVAICGWDSASPLTYSLLYSIYKQSVSAAKTDYAFRKMHNVEMTVRPKSAEINVMTVRLLKASLLQVT